MAEAATAWQLKTRIILFLFKITSVHKRFENVPFHVEVDVRKTEMLNCKAG